MKLYDFENIRRVKVSGDKARWFREGERIFRNLTDYDQRAIFDFIEELLLFQVKAARSAVEVDIELLEKDDLFEFADKIDKVYDETGCYFCSPLVDPNEKDFHGRDQLCLKCKIKLENIFEFMGLERKSHLRLIEDMAEGND